MIVDATLSATRLTRAHAEIVRALGTGPVDASFEASGHDPAVLDEARRFWRARMLAEHRSVPVFLLLGAQLFEAGAPLDAQTVMARLAQDELRHTELCAVMLRALGDSAAIHTDATAAPLATHAGCSLAERALRNVVYACCLSEMVAVGRLIDTLEHTTEPLARQVTRSILADEIMHGQFGFLYLEATRPDDETRASLASYLEHAFAVLESEMVRPAAVASAAARALGVCDGPRGHEIFYGTIEGAVVPGLEALGVEAARAWRRRRRAAPDSP